MQIHVVMSGDTLFSIANTYNSEVAAIIAVNELNMPNLVIGQALVIPIVGQYYFVQSGDSLFKVANRFNMSTEELARVNNISLDMILPIGLRLYIPPQPKQETTVFGYAEPIGEDVSTSLENTVEKRAPLLTYLAPFSYRVNRDGTLNAPPLNRFQEISINNQTNMSLVVTNLEGDSFNSELAHIVLTVQAVQNKLIDEIINTAKVEGFHDVHFDFEFIPEDDREAYNNFLRKIAPQLHEEGLLISTALAPKTSSTQSGLLYEAHDYAAHGEIVDFSVLMTYEWGYSAGPPRAVSPINEVKKVLEYAISVMPSNKILMGQNLYGYDWTLPFVQGESFARALSPQQAITLADEHGAEIHYDETAQAPFFNYNDMDGLEHVVWFEDARSIQAKFNLIKQLDLKGIAYWKLGLSFPQNWLLLDNYFTILKSTN